MNSQEQLNYDIYVTSLVFAMDDLESAVRYIHDNSDKYGLNDHEIIIGGYSAGAVTSLHYAYITSVDDLFLLSESDIFTNLHKKNNHLCRNLQKKI